MNRTIIAAAAVGIALVGCGSAVATTSIAAPATAPFTSSAAAPTTAVAVMTSPTANAAPANALASWCALTIGLSRAALRSVMSSSDAQQTHDYDTIGASLLASVGDTKYTFEVWYASHSTLFATFDATGTTVDLQAYKKPSITLPSTEIGCTAFRAAPTR